MKNRVLTVENLTFKYGRNDAIRNISCIIEKGDYLGIIGPNGSGKTTLLNVILGLLEPTKGSINFSKEAQIGYLPQRTIKTDKLFPAKVKEIVATGLLSNKGMFKFYTEEDYEKIDNILKRLNIYDLKYKKIGELSGGQQQRVFLARAMVSSPNVILLDEPTNYLDTSTREELYRILKELNTEEKVTIIVVSHDLKTMGKYINKVLYLETELIFYGDYKLFLHSKEIGRYLNPIDIDEIDGGI
ncbi:metal ABC transporter ATP-binding protein [Tissierella praeacuta]|uniref:metal ABC transporter ATP-binding protein n=1 Tax=Tissierella praeacuta TaxID=43131 RepID=UPI001C12834B|nr:ABC transporter ATP-binding protein [Tissierella praeacuta]MBU5256295.1 ABC transporter ATP-binding protein [Tissierella praeacuta]